MKDRVPVNPGRVLITPESGNPYYATLTRADNPTQEGDSLNKNTLLKDATAAAFGLGPEAVPDDVFNKIKTLINKNATDIASGVKIATGSYVGTGTGGRDNHTILTFSFAPKLVIITKYNSDNNYHDFPWRDGTLINMEALKQAINSGSYRPKFAVMYDASNTVGADASITNDGKTLDWYVWESGAEVPKKQLNASGVVYDYIAIG